MKTATTRAQWVNMDVVYWTTMVSNYLHSVCFPTRTPTNWHQMGKTKTTSTIWWSTPSGDARWELSKCEEEWMSPVTTTLLWVGRAGQPPWATLRFELFKADPKLAANTLPPGRMYHQTWPKEWLYQRKAYPTATTGGALNGYLFPTNHINSRRSHQRRTSWIQERQGLYWPDLQSQECSAVHRLSEGFWQIFRSYSIPFHIVNMIQQLERWQHQLYGRIWSPPRMCDGRVIVQHHHRLGHSENNRRQGKRNPMDPLFHHWRPWLCRLPSPPLAYPQAIEGITK